MAIARHPVQFLVGGPDRFSDDFTEAVDDAEVAGFSSDDYLLATALVSNAGLSDLRDAASSRHYAGGSTLPPRD